MQRVDPLSTTNGHTGSGPLVVIDAVNRFAPTSGRRSTVETVLTSREAGAAPSPIDLSSRAYTLPATAPREPHRDEQSIVEELGPYRPLPTLAAVHLHQFPYRAPENVKESLLWYEGTFDPLGPHHLEIFLQTYRMGFERAVLGIVFQNPYKPKSTPYEHRAEMARRALEAEGVPVVDDPRQPGVCIFRESERFNEQRMRVLFDQKASILIGPDNFEVALANNVLWVHPPEIRENPAAASMFGFRSLYNNVPGFRKRILVYPVLHDLHATDIREGRGACLPVIREYIEERALYQDRAPAVAAPPALKATTPGKPRLSESQVLLHQEVEAQLAAALKGVGLYNDQMGERLHTVLSGLDRSQLVELKYFLNADADEGVRKKSGGTVEYHRSSPTLQTIREAVSDILLADRLQTFGSEHVLEALEQRKRIVFVGNHSGWGDTVLLTQALRQNGIGAIADRVNFVTNTDCFPAGFLANVLAQSFTRLRMEQPAAGAVAATDEVIDGALGHGLQRLRKDGAIAFFPEIQPSNNGVHPFGPHLIEALHPEALKKQGLDLDDVVVIPWAQRGGLTLREGNGASFSEESPPLVGFGEGIPLRTLETLRRQKGATAAGHLLGLRVAELVPSEHRGVYGAYSEGFLDRSAEPSGVSENFLQELGLVRRLNSELRARRAAQDRTPDVSGFQVH